MSEYSTADRVIEIVKRQCDFSDDVKILRTDSFVEDLKCDSLDIEEIILSVERAFGIIVPEAVYDNIRTVGALIIYCESRVGG